MSATLNEQPVALREWAVAVKALAEGKQAVVLRKGGIAEETRDFQLISPSFYLLPGYEHQRPELLKEEYRGGVAETLTDWRPENGTVSISAYAEAVDDFGILDQESLDRIREYHIWTDSFAEERLKWKKTKPLHVILLRVYKLETPVEIPMLESYAGCKSWVRLEERLPAHPLKPVLSDEEFGRLKSEITGLLSR